MIEPNKYVPVESSLIGLGATLLTILSQTQTQSELWDLVKTSAPEESYYRFIAALDLLYTIGLIRLVDDVFLVRR